MRLSLYLVAACFALLLGAAGAEAQTVRNSSSTVTKISATKTSATKTKASQRKVATKRQYAKRTNVASRHKARNYASARTTRSAATRTASVERSTVTSEGTAVAAWRSTASVANVGPRPKAWCGWWMRTQRGGGPELNVAWNWSKWGRPTSPQVGAVVVWRHHVGEIVGEAGNGKWLVRSGNYAGGVRTVPMSVRGAVFRI